LRRSFHEGLYSPIDKNQHGAVIFKSHSALNRSPLGPLSRSRENNDPHRIQVVSELRSICLVAGVAGCLQAARVDDVTMTTAAPETEMDNVASLDVYNMTSPNNVTSREDGQELFAKLVEQAIVRYVLPVVILIGNTILLRCQIESIHTNFY